MALFLKFADEEKRAAFLRDLTQHRPDLIDACSVNPAVPIITARIAADDDVAAIQRLVAPFGTIHDDVQFGYGFSGRGNRSAR